MSKACGSCASGNGQENGHNHNHNPKHNHDTNHSHNHNPKHEHNDDQGCGCGHEHAEVSIRSSVIRLAIAVVIAVVAMLPQIGAIPSMILYGISILVTGYHIFWQGLKNIAKLNFDELTLLTIAVVAACAIGEFPEALLVTLLFSVGEILEQLAVARSRREVEAVTKIVPDNANLSMPDGSVKSVPAASIQIGDTIIVRSGERVPVDCTVLSGHSSADTSSLTGESAPRDIVPQDQLLSGFVNIGGVLTCRADDVLQNSTAAKIVEMVRESAEKKGRSEKLISRFAKIYTPVVIVAAILIATLPPLLGFGEFTMWLGRSLVFLVASCPCALVIATPLSFFAGIGGCSKKHILIKGSKYMEVLANTSTAVFDKTGTLTTGKLSVRGITAAPDADAREVLLLAASCESGSNHPVAAAITAHFDGEIQPPSEIEEITAHGMRAIIGGDTVLCGSERLMKLFDVDISGLGDANVYVAKNGRALGAIQVSDTVRSDARATMAALEKLGVRSVHMLTGDGEAAAKATASEAGITNWAANLLPADKVSRFEAIKKTATGSVLFVGDGINDSPVLALSDAGVAMGVASDAAIEAADVVLLSDKLSSLPEAIRIARKTTRLARFNIAFTIAIKLIVLVLAFLGLSTMWMAVFADVGVTVLSVLNATRALKY